MESKFKCEKIKKKMENKFKCEKIKKKFIWIKKINEFIPCKKILTTY